MSLHTKRVTYLNDNTRIINTVLAFPIWSKDVKVEVDLAKRPESDRTSFFDVIVKLYRYVFDC